LTVFAWQNGRRRAGTRYDGADCDRGASGH